MYFKNPENTWIFLLLLVPILIHLIRFRKQKKLFFPGVFRLISILQETQSTNKLKHYILLANRFLIFLCIAWLFTEPSCQKNIRDSKSQIGVIWDNSPSMWEADENGNIPIENAKIQTLSWLKQLPPDAEIIWLEKPYQDKVNISVNEAVEKVRNASNSDIYSSVDQLFQLNTLSSVSQKWYLISDLDTDVKHALRQLKKRGISPEIVNFQINRNQNVSLDSAYCENLLEEKFQIHVSRNDLKVAVNSQFEIWLDGIYAGNQMFEFNDQEPSKWIEVKLSQSVGKRIEFRLPKDAYNPDNYLYLHPISNKKIKIYQTSPGRFKEIDQLLNTFSDRMEKTQKIEEADLFFLIGESVVEADFLKILERIKSGNQAIVIPENTKVKIPFGLINGGKWERLEQGNEMRLDYRGFKTWPFDEALNKDIQLDLKTITPKIATFYRFAFDQNRDWQRYLITENDQDFLIKKDIGEGKIWLFTSDYQMGLSDLKKSTWFVGVMAPLLLISNLELDAVCGFIHEDWIPVPQSEKFEQIDKITISKEDQTWTSSLGMNQGKLCFTGIKGENLKSGWYQLSADNLKDSIPVGLNSPRIEQRFIPEKEEISGALKVISIPEWMSQNVHLDSNRDYLSFFKYLLWFLVILELILGVFVLRTNR